MQFYIHIYINMCIKYKWSTDTSIQEGGQWCKNYKPQSCKLLLLLLLLLYIHVLHLLCINVFMLKKKHYLYVYKKRYL